MVFPSEEVESSNCSDSSESMDKNDNHEDGEDFGRINLTEDDETPKGGTEILNKLTVKKILGGQT